MKPADQGFTLIELMIGMVMTGIIVGIIYSAYSIQTKIYTEQGKVAEMQQNIRATLAFMQREARMAGYNPTAATHPTCNEPGNTAPTAPGIFIADESTFGFSMDLDGSGDCTGAGENITYSLDTASGAIERTDNSSGVTSSIADDITNIRFVYMFKPPQAPKWGPLDLPLPGDDLSDVRAVQVSLLAQAKYPDRNAPAAMSFTLPLIDDHGTIIGDDTVWGPFNDGHRRRLLTTTINLRNMGL